MKLNVQRILCFVLVFVMAFAIVGCKERVEDPENTNPSTTQILPPPPPPPSYRGQKLTIATLEDSPESIFLMACGEEPTGYEVHDAIFQRDSAMVDTFGIDVYYM